MPNPPKPVSEINTFLSLPEEPGGKKKRIFFVLVPVLLIFLAIFSYFREKGKENSSGEQMTEQKQEPAHQAAEPAKAGNAGREISAQPPKQEAVPDVKSGNADENSSHQSEKDMPAQPHQSAVKQETAKSAASWQQTLYFAYQNPELSPEAAKSIREMADRISYDSGRLIIDGHKYASGSEESATSLSKNRVNNIANAFRETGLGMNVRFFKIYYGGQHLPSGLNRENSGGKVEIQFVPDKTKAAAASE